MQNKVAVHYAREYLAQTTTWIYGQIKHNTNYKPIVLSNKIMNLDQFPCSDIYSLKSDLQKWHQYGNKIGYFFTGYYPYFRKQAEKHHPDIIHAHFGNIGYKAISLSKKLNVPLITTFYGYDASTLALKKKYQKRFKELFMEGSLFLAEGNYLRKTLIGLGCPEEKAKVFHLGVEVENYPFRKRIINESQPVKLLFAARLIEKKGANYAILAFNEAKKIYPNIKLKMIGEGPEKDTIAALIEKLSLQDEIELHGYTNYQQFIRELTEADIFIQPSVSASDGNTEGGSPVSLIDAQATGIPVLSTYHADIPEVVLHKKTGLLAPERDYITLADNLLTLLENPGLMVEYGIQGRKHIEENYNVKTQGEILSRIYDEVCQ